ncbi:helix-turn-helix domain-containing protein [Neisseria perflava]|uniref:helix-turn-helix domain-containing protein n=1 Tax=Neisseria perflava TaxID=33053 RepID=UPI0020A12ABD|nr:helix-turn-helix domain-containing protein [Neisseria perflava]MCP1659298.1 Ner family transcriptional regulator [Neisseria perflava]MCP1773486.1 Ner family transcriptional regulator [Neisseria perflava]
MSKIKLDWHRADVVAALKKRGWSVRALSIASGLAPNTLGTALQCPYLKGEKIIADAIGISPNEIWPSRYKARELKPRITELSK